MEKEHLPSVQQTGFQISNLKQALESYRVKDVSQQAVGSALMYAFAVLGIKEKHQPEGTEKHFLIKFICDEYPNYRVDEIRLAFTLAAKGKLDIDEHYHNFSPMYFGKVMKGYEDWKRENPVKKAVEAPKRLPEALTNELNTKAFLEFFESFKTAKKSQAIIYWYWYDFLSKKGLIDLSDEKRQYYKDLALEDENKRLSIQASNTDWVERKHIMRQIENLDKSKAVINRAKEKAVDDWVLNHIEQGTDIEGLLNF